MGKCLERILVYGTGAVARKVIKNYKSKGVVIAGVLDRIRVSGSFENISIVEWKDIYENMADAVVIAAPKFL